MSKINVLLVKCDQKPQVVEIENTLRSMQDFLDGNIEIISPFEDEEVMLVCNEEGKINHLKLNRAIYQVPEYIEMTYSELKSILTEHENKRQYKEKPLTARIVFAKDSFQDYYSKESRTYEFTSDNKIFQSKMRGYSLFGSAIDGSDNEVRLEQYMSDEFGGAEGWKIEKCFLKKENNEIVDIIAGDFFLCYFNRENGEIESLPIHLISKYRKIFETPQQFLMDLNTTKIIVKSIGK